MEAFPAWHDRQIFSDRLGDQSIEIIAKAQGCSEVEGIEGSEDCGIHPAGLCVRGA